MKSDFAVYLTAFAFSAAALARDPLPSWNDGADKQAIISFVRATTDSSAPGFVPPELRLAIFDQDGTSWVEYPIFLQVIYCLDCVPALVKARLAPNLRI
jgi:hypothetical protein